MRQCFLRSLAKINRARERGQVLVMAAGSMVVILGFTALATDVGLYLRDSRDAQNDADAAALAGAAAFMLTPPDADQAILLAEDWAANNDASGEIVWTGDGPCGSTPSGDPIPWGVTDTDGNTEVDTVCLEIERSSPALFARVLGVDHFDVDRQAAARAVHADHGAVCPWALKAIDPSDTDPSGGDYLGVQMGKIYAIKVGAGEAGTGNFGILRLYPLDCPGGGTACYVDALESACAANGYNVFTQGDVIETSTEPGVVGNPTMTALETYFGYELNDDIEDLQGFAWCDVPMDWDDVNGIGTPNGYDPAVAPGPRQGCSTDATNGKTGRYLLIPIVDSFPPSGTGPVQILAIAAVYMAGWGEWDPDTGGYDRQGPPGQAKVYVQFVEEAPYKPKDLIGTSDNPLAPMRITLIR